MNAEATMLKGRCDDCHEWRDDLREVVVNDTPGSGEGRPVKMLLCERCYQENGWREAELTSAHLLALDERHD